LLSSKIIIYLESYTAKLFILTSTVSSVFIASDKLSGFPTPSVFSKDYWQQPKQQPLSEDTVHQQLKRFS